jgi:hypothetical protein
MGIILWTPAEHEIVRNSSFSEALVRLPNRTAMAIKAMRKNLRVGPPLVRWTKGEIRRLRKYCHEPILKLARRFTNRTADAVRHQRKAMGLCPLAASPVSWKTTDMVILKKIYPSSPRNEILSTFPNRTWAAIKAKAEIQGWRRAKRAATGTNDLQEAVGTRAREDGISLGKLGRQTGCGTYFLNSRRSKKVDFNKIARVVEFFGGKLMIDWQDE